jgi:hypothetical protein
LALSALLALALGMLGPAGVAATGRGATGSASPAMTFTAEAHCLATGGLRLTLTLTNNTNQALTIEDDIHVTLYAGTPVQQVGRGRQVGQALATLFVSPAPSHQVIPPGESRAFTLDLGAPEGDEPALDLDEDTLSLLVEVRFAGFPRAIARAFSFPGCPLLSGGLEGGVLATFDVLGEQFRVWVTNPATIQQLFDLQAGLSDASIPSGRLLTGPGQADHNAPWSWHLDPEEIEMAEFTIELCDSTPSYVEANLAEIIATVGYFCPWSAELVSIEDFRL